MKSAKYAVALSWHKQNSAGMTAVHTLRMKNISENEKENHSRAIDICLKRGGSLKNTRESFVLIGSAALRVV